MDFNTEIEFNQQNLILIAQVVLIIASFIILMIKIANTK